MDRVARAAGGRPAGYPTGGRPAPPPGSQSSSIMSRAERFDDEKRRIIDTCFGRVDPNTGMPAETYITHVRVVEDARYPQDPPPPDSAPDHKKDRVIIIAVRNTGRVRMHKARENQNRSFSIGKTWNLEDLTGLQSYSHLSVQSDSDAQAKERAGDVGFIVTISKPYYWQATTQKEKDFFLASLVKVYRKYTQGKVPELNGFSPAEVEQILGQTGPPSRGPPSGGPPPQSLTVGRNRGYGSSEVPAGGRVPSRQMTPSSAGLNGAQPSPPISQEESLAPTSSYYQQRPPSSQDRSPSRSRYGYQKPDSLRPGVRPKPSNDQNLRQAKSREQMRPYPVQLPQSLTPQSSVNNFNTNRDGTPDSMSSRGRPRPSPYMPGVDGPGLGESANDGNGLGISSSTMPKVNGDSSSRYGTQSPAPLSESSRSPAAVPERKRPLMAGAQSFDSSTTKQNDSPEGETVDGSSTSRDVKLQSFSSKNSFPKDPSETGSMRSDREVFAPQPVQAGRQISESQKSIQSDPSLDVKAPELPLPEKGEAAAEKEDEEELRPGLGRMFGNNKKTARDLLKSAANAYTAFKPRAGGAVAKLRAAEEKTSNEPDGISGVVPAPSLLRTGTNDSVKSPQDKSSIQATPTSAKGGEKLPDLKVTSPQSPEKDQEALFPDITSPDIGKDAVQQKAKAEEDLVHKKTRRNAAQIKYLENLGIDPSMLEGRGLEIESVLEEFWSREAWHSKPLEILEADIRRQVSCVETGSWLSAVEHGHGFMSQVNNLLDNAIDECDVLDKLLTMYSLELGSLQDDIAYIEAQGQGLQVQAANQKLLHAELKTLLEVVTVPPQQLDILRRYPLDSLTSIEEAEKALLGVYKALLLIDPSLRQRKNTTPDEIQMDNELSEMRAVQENRDKFFDASASFLARFKSYADVVYGEVVYEIQDMHRRMPPAESGTKLSVESINSGKQKLWQLSPIMLYAREVDKPIWREMMRAYQMRMHPILSDQFIDAVKFWRKSVRPSTGDEQELLFTYEGSSDGLAGAARKLTVKRSQTLARSLRSASAEKAARTNGLQSNSLYPFQSFAGALDDMTPVVFAEQNFLVDFFHAKGIMTMDFADAVAAAPLGKRVGADPLARKAYETDRDVARMVGDVMEEMFPFFITELQNMVEWALNMDSLQGVGILHAINSVTASLDETNQEFLIKTLSAIATRIQGMWNRFLDGQVRAIEDTKVKINKRKGVINFIKTFANFSIAIENMLPPASEEPAERSEVRALVDQAYDRINTAMFESLKVIAKESPSSGHAAHLATGGASGDPEDKEALNYHILLIENMNHYAEEVDPRGDNILEKGRNHAVEELEEHLDLYVDSVVRRPLGKLLDFTESLTHALTGLPPGTSASSLATRPSFTPSALKKAVSAYDAKELRRGIDALRRRVEKHFGDADEHDLSRGLVAKVLGACEARYVRDLDGLRDMAREVYGEEGVAVVGGMGGGREELGRWFRGGK